MLTQDFTLRLKQLPDEDGTFTGYGSTYGGPPDLVGDIIEPGAFQQSIAQQGKGLPLLWSHRTDQPIGSDVPHGQGKVSYADDGTRTLKEIKLYEISLVAIPANPRAQITAVKSLADCEHVVRALRDATEPDALFALKSIDRELKRLLAGAGRDSDDAEALSALRELDSHLK